MYIFLMVTGTEFSHSRKVGALYDSTFIVIEVDTLRQEVFNKDLIITTVNKEFVYTLPQNKKTQHVII